MAEDLDQKPIATIDDVGSSEKVGKVLDPDEKKILGFAPRRIAELFDPQRVSLPIVIQNLSAQGLIKVDRSLDPDPERPYALAIFENTPDFIQAIKEGKADPLLHAISLSFHNIYGGKPWKEWLVCSNSSTEAPCKRKIGPDDITPGLENTYADLTTFEAATSFNPAENKCSDCGNALQFLYPLDETFHHLSRELQNDMVGGIGLDQNFNIAGFILLWITTNRNCWNDKVIPASKEEKGEGLPQEVFEQAILNLKEENMDLNGVAIKGAELGVIPKSREQGLGFKLIQAAYSLAAEKIEKAGVTPAQVFFHGVTLDNSPALKLFLSIGFQRFIPMPDGKIRVYGRLDKLLAGIEKKLQKNL